MLGVSSVSAENDNQIDDSNDFLTANESLQSEEISQGQIQSLQSVEDDSQIAEDDELGIGNDEDVLSDTGAFSELEEAFLKNDKFTFTKDYVANSNDGRINLKRSIEIDGNGHSIDGRGYVGIFQADSSASNNIEVLIKNLKFKNALADDGGAIYVDDADYVKLTIINCSFIANSANEDGGAIYFSSFNGVLNIQDSYFYNNVALDSLTHKSNGGAINFGEGEFILERSSFVINEAYGYGGAIYAKGTINFTYCNFTSNICHESGGAVYTDGEVRGIRNSRFERNLGAAASYGGGIYVDSGNKNGVVIENCSFLENDVIGNSNSVNRGSGGAICSDASGLVRVINSNFTRNSAKLLDSRLSVLVDLKGGAIYCKNDIEIDGCYFDGNYAKDSGGAIHANSGLRWLANPSVFVNNYVGNLNGAVANKGGAIYASTFLNTAKGLTFINNSAVYGGAIYINNKCDVTLELCTFVDNVAKGIGIIGRGGFIYLDSYSAKLSLYNNIISNNRGLEDKGVYNYGTFSHVEHNWWGINNPNFSDGYLVEYKSSTFDTMHSDSDPLGIVLSSDKNLTAVNSEAILTVMFVNSNGQEFTSDLPKWEVEFFANQPANFTSIQYLSDNRATVNFTPLRGGSYTVSAKVNNQTLSIDMTIDSEFANLQRLVDNAEGVLDLERDIFYTIGADTITEGIVIDKAIEINGHGYAIDAMGQSRIFNVLANDVVFRNITFINAKSNDGGAILLNHANNTRIVDCIFINNTAEQYGGAIYSQGGNNTLIDGCIFKFNTASIGGAMDIYTPNSSISKTNFIGNRAGHGGAIYSDRSILTVDGCEFTNNSADYGGAIYFLWDNDAVANSNFTGNVATYSGSAIFWKGSNGRVLNSKFIENRASIKNINIYTSNALILDLIGEENYINAITSEKELIFSNVTYWNGSITTSDNPVNSYNISGIHVVIEISSNGRLVKNITLTTDINGRVIYDYYELDNGNYTFRAYSASDAYYTKKEVSGEFEVSRSEYSGDVEINITDKQEFDFGTNRISFTVADGQTVRVLITDEEGSRIFADSMTDLNYIDVDLPASDEYYNLTVFTLGNETHAPSKDSKLFKILKANSTIVIDPIDNVGWGNNVTISFKGDTHTYNVTVYDSNNVAVFSQIINEQSVIVSNLNVGEYNVTVINIGEGNTYESRNSTKFSVLKKINEIHIIANDQVYGENTLITVNADVDGEYNLNINSNIVKVNVTGNTGRVYLTLGAGEYVVNATLGNMNCVDSCKNVVFNVSKAQSKVRILASPEITYGQNNMAQVRDNYPAEYKIVIYNSEGTEVYANSTFSELFTIPSDLNVGTYNMTVTNLGNENITQSQDSFEFNVTRNNHVQVSVENVSYGRALTVVLFSNVDGNYSIDINGTKMVITTVDGFGFNDTLYLDAGDYYANVSCNITDFNNIFTNARFTVYKFIPKLSVNVESVDYGETVIVNFTDDYQDTYHITVKDQDGNIVFDKTDEFLNKTVELANLPVGSYNCTVENNGTANRQSIKVSAIFKVFGKKIIVSDMIRGYNSGVDFMATLVDQDGNAVSNENVTFAINGKNYYATTNANGVASINPKLNVGTYNVTVTDPTTGVKINKTLKIVTRITGNKNVNTYYGKNYQYKLRIIGDNGSPAGAGVAVKVTINGKAQTLKTDKNGYITVKFTKNYLPKTYTVKAEYKGVKVSNKVVVKKVLKLKKVKVKRSAKKLKLKATLKEGKKALKGKKVVFKFKGKKYTAKTNKKGVAKVTIKKKILKKLKKGKKVKYQATYLKHTVKRTVKVKR